MLWTIKHFIVLVDQIIKKKEVLKMKRYAVSEKGIILGYFDTRIKDGCRWCVDYSGETTGELCHDSKKNRGIWHLGKSRCVFSENKSRYFK